VSQIPPLEPVEGSGSVPGEIDGRLASVVHIMKGRRSIRSSLGVLALDNGSVSLRNAEDSLLFNVPATSVEARQRRRLAVYQTFFEVRAEDRWWNLVAWVPTKYQRRSTRELVERAHPRQLVPRLPGMSEESYHRIISNPVRHQMLWAVWWVATLSMAAKGKSSPSQRAEPRDDDTGRFGDDSAPDAGPGED
jgi:hypothetical protein